MAGQNFRSAFNGFRREDVVHYIEYMNTRHAAELNQLRSEKQQVQDELDELRETVAAENLSSRVAELENRCMELEQMNMTVEDSLEEERQKQTQMQEQIDLLRRDLEQMTAQRDQALEAQSNAKDLAEQELEAYRRAEKMERSAKERADRVYRQATGTLAEATTHVDAAAERFRGIAERVSSQIEELQDAIACSKNALLDAATSMMLIIVFYEFRIIIMI